MGTLHGFRQAPDDEIFSEMERILDPQRMRGELDYNVVAFYQQELTRRAVRDLAASSDRLEKLTKVLVALTVVLLIVALPPAVDAVMKLVSPAAHGSVAGAARSNSPLQPTSTASPSP